MSKPVFIVMVGLPGSGKSTLLAGELKGFVGDFSTFKVLSTDSIVEEFAQFRGKTYNQVWAGCIDAATKIFNGDLDSAIELGENIVVDQTNMSIKKRKKLLNLAGSKYYTMAVVVDTDVETCISRRSVGKIIPEHVIREMASRYEPVSFDEGFDAIINLGGNNA